MTVTACTRMKKVLVALSVHDFAGLRFSYTLARVTRRASALSSCFVKCCEGGANEDDDDDEKIDEGSEDVFEVEDDKSAGYWRRWNNAVASTNFMSMTARAASEKCSAKTTKDGGRAVRPLACHARRLDSVESCSGAVA